MRILDLFCGAGGAAMGYHRAFPDALIVGIDIDPQPDYPFNFIQGDVTKLPLNMDGYDMIHASPPCQAYSTMTRDNDQHPDLIGEVRDMLKGRQGIIENVPGAPLRRDLLLCGSMFGLQVQRHRLFEFTWDDALDVFLWNPPQCRHEWAEGRPWTVTGTGGGGKYKHSWKHKNLEHAQELMDMPWVTKKRGITEAIPPAYTEWIGQQLKDTL